MIYLLNGPPRCGKDTAGEILANLLPYAANAKFAGALKEATHAFFHALHGRLRPSNVDAVVHHGAYEYRKGDAMALFCGLTPRAAYIAVSEKLCKPMFGERFFGEILAERMDQPDIENWIITDSGFPEEAEPIVKHFGADECRLVRLHRPGCTFEGDSRSHIEIPGVLTFDIQNDGTLADLRSKLRNIV